MNDVSPDPSGINDDSATPRLRPGTYELTKRVEVDEDGIARFVDMPDGPDAEYVAGFWHKTRSWVRRLYDESSSGNGVTDEDSTARRMAKGRQWIARHGLASYLPSWDELTPDEQKQAETEARHWINAAVNAGISIVPAGRTVVDLPEPGGRSWPGSAQWEASARTIAAKVDEQGRPYVTIDGQIWLVGEAESVGLALVAAAREAQRQAAEPASGVAGGDGDDRG